MTRSFLTGLIGAGITTSLSPPLHEVEAAALGVRSLYRLIDIDRTGGDPDDAPRLARAARELGFDGVNVTYPCKRTVLSALDELSAEAETLRAVNTVVVRDGRLIGHNTDWSGFGSSLRRGLPGVPLGQVVVVGAGGAGAAVVYALARAGAASITVLDRDPARAGELTRTLTPHVEAHLVPDDATRVRDHLRNADGVVHATPAGMTGHGGSAIPFDSLRADLWVADIVYRPLDTDLLTAARARGCRTLHGGGMVVLQAADSFELFTGIEPDRERMLAHFDHLTRSTAA